MAATNGKKSPTHIARVKLTDFKDKKKDEGAIEIETADGTVFRIDPPELWTDEVMRLAQDDDNLAVAALLIGLDSYDDFVAKGGSAALVMAIIADVKGVTVPQ